MGTKTRASSAAVWKSPLDRCRTSGWTSSSGLQTPSTEGTRRRRRGDPRMSAVNSDAPRTVDSTPSSALMSSALAFVRMTTDSALAAGQATRAASNGAFGRRLPLDESPIQATTISVGGRAGRCVPSMTGSSEMTAWPNRCCRHSMLAKPASTARSSRHSRLNSSAPSSRNSYGLSRRRHFMLAVSHHVRSEPRQRLQLGPSASIQASPFCVGLSMGTVLRQVRSLRGLAR